VVAQLMGHANVDTTLNVYTQVLDGTVRLRVEKSAMNCSQSVNSRNAGLP
jgi:site-specific recombinase XerD